MHGDAPQPESAVRGTPGVQDTGNTAGKRARGASARRTFSSMKLRQPSRGTKQVIFLPFLISWTRTALRMAELGCLDSMPLRTPWHSGGSTVSSGHGAASPCAAASPSPPGIHARKHRPARRRVHFLDADALGVGRALEGGLPLGGLVSLLVVLVSPPLCARQGTPQRQRPRSPHTQDMRESRADGQLRTLAAVGDHLARSADSPRLAARAQAVSRAAVRRLPSTIAQPRAQSTQRRHRADGIAWLTGRRTL
jgi:hypothetical protein